MKAPISSFENILTGKWRIISLYTYVQEQGWILFKRYRKSSYIWEFMQERTLTFSSGEFAYAGKLGKYYNGHPDETMDFSYYPADRQLYIDSSDYEQDGFMSTCINDRYRIERTREGEYWLYDLEDVMKEPGDYKFRMKIKKFGMSLS